MRAETKLKVGFVKGWINRKPLSGFYRAMLAQSAVMRQ